jgi:hypothetical protein
MTKKNKSTFHRMSEKAKTEFNGLNSTACLKRLWKSFQLLLNPRLMNCCRSEIAPAKIVTICLAGVHFERLRYFGFYRDFFLSIHTNINFSVTSS